MRVGPLPPKALCKSQNDGPEGAMHSSVLKNSWKYSILCPYWCFLSVNVKLHLFCRM